MLNAIHQFPLPLLFFFTLAVGFSLCWIVIVIVRAAVPALGFSINEILPIRDSIINAVGALFALIVAFSAAGIWNDHLAARNAVQREADAIENAITLTAGLPETHGAQLRENLKTYAQSILSIDWPAMQRGATLDDDIFLTSEKLLVEVVESLARQQATLGSLATYGPLLGQLLEARHARLARLAAASAGVSGPQWITMLLIAMAALSAVAICNSHSFAMQITATHIYTVAVAAAFFVILSHDRPFVGNISVTPAAFSPFIQR